MGPVDAGAMGQTNQGLRIREHAFGWSAVRTSLVVGTALTLINHPEVVRVGFGPDLLLPLLLNYLVPFLVAGYSRHRLLARLRVHGGQS